MARRLGLSGLRDRMRSSFVGGRWTNGISAHRDISLHWILLHLAEETARHLGYIDLLRERADGSTGEKPTQ